MIYLSTLPRHAWYLTNIVCQQYNSVVDRDGFLQHRALSHIRICRPPPLSFDPTFMKYAQCAESKEKSILRFLFFELS